MAAVLPPIKIGAVLPKGAKTRKELRERLDLLVITQNDNNQADHEILQQNNQLAEPLNCEVTTVVQSMDAVNDLIAKNSRFDYSMKDVLKENKLLEYKLIHLSESILLGK